MNGDAVNLLEKPTLRDALKRGSVDDLMAVLRPLSASQVACVLNEAGFPVDARVVRRGRAAVFDSVRGDLEKALEQRVDGFGLARIREQGGDEMGTVAFAAKGDEAGPQTAVGFVGDRSAADVIQRVMRASAISVGLVGARAPAERGSLLLVAGQALKEGVQGFGFDGVPGKYQVPLSMPGLVELHQRAAQALAEESARRELGRWASGAKVVDVDTWVPDSVQRLLLGTVSLEAAQALTSAIESGSIGRHAREIGAHEFERVLSQQGLDVKAPTVEEQSRTLKLEIHEVDTGRGQYFGLVMGVDHRAALIQFARTQAVVLPFAALGNGQDRPKLGDSVRMVFKDGSLTVRVAARGERGVGR